jgi:hypothetical protein
MPLTAKQILEGLGIDPTLYAGKTAELSEWDGKLAASETAANQATEKAKQELSDAAAIKRVIDDNIANFGVTEASVAQLKAANASYQAAFEELKKQGFNELNLPNLPAPTAGAVDPAKQLLDNVTRGFTQIGQTMRVQNQYMNIYGKALPDDPMTLADEAAARRMSVEAYAEQKYGFAAERTRQSAESAKKHDEEISAKAVKDYQEKHPNTAGNPNLNGGVPSNYPAMPPPRESGSIREFSALPARDKIANAMQRASKATTQVQ